MGYILVLYVFTLQGWVQADIEKFPPHYFQTKRECEYAADYWNSTMSRSAGEVLGANMAECKRWRVG